MTISFTAYFTYLLQFRCLIFFRSFFAARQRLFSEKADISGRLKSFIPYARNTFLCSVAENLSSDKTGEKCKEYSKYCPVLQTGNLISDFGTLILAFLGFLMYGKNEFVLTAGIISVFAASGICLICRAVFGIFNRYIISHSVAVIRRAETGKHSKFLTLFSLIAPVADITIYILSKKTNKKDGH